MTSQTSLALLTAVLWAVGILLSRASGGTPVQLAVLGCFGTGIVAIPIALIAQNAIASGRVLGLGLAGGIFNGLGVATLFAMFAIASTRDDWEISKIVPTIYAGVIVIVALGAAYFFSETFSMPKLFAVALIIAGIWLFSLK